MAANRTLYLLTCDLRGAIDYQPFLDELSQGLQAKEILRSQWVIGSSLDPMEIRDRLRTHLGPEGGLLIVEIGRWASDNTFVNINEVDLVNQSPLPPVPAATVPAAPVSDSPPVGRIGIAK